MEMESCRLFWATILLFHPVHWEKYESNYSPHSYGHIVGQSWLFNFGMVTDLGEGKTLSSNPLNTT